MNYIDLHCDTLSEAFLKGKKDIFCFPEAMADVQRLQSAGAAAQFFAIFMIPQSDEIRNRVRIPDDDAYIDALCEILQRTVQEHSDVIAPAGNAADLERNYRMGKISAFLTLEDGRAVNGSMEKLEYFYEKGIRLISLTWNFENCFGAPNSVDRTVMEQGLTPFGKEAVCRMEELGMIVDVSHLSDGGFWDVANVLRGPFVASHSNCRALSPHPRNLTDEMLRALGERGGVAGLNFCPAFLHQDITCRKSTTERMIAHVKHMANKGGIGCVAVGTDFDGIQGDLEVGTPEKMELLFSGLSEAGFTTGEIEKIAFGNAERAIREIMGA